MKNIKTLAFLIILAFLVNTKTQAQGIAFFEGNFSQAKLKAAKEGKKIFIDFYTSWCRPCKFMAAEYFTLETVGSVYNKNYVCLKIDAEKGEGLKLVKKYDVKAYPTIVYAKADGILIKKEEGLKNEKQLLELSK